MAKHAGINSPLYWFTLLGFGAPRRPHPVGYTAHIASVYVMVAGDDAAVKIGVSTNPGNRLRSLQTGQDRIIRIFWATELEFGDAHELERAVHARLKSALGVHASGEWYYIAPETAVGVIQREIEAGKHWAIPDRCYGMFREGTR